MDTFISGTDRDRIQAQLTPDEELLWSGKYEPSLLESNCLLFIGMGLVFAWAGTAAMLSPQEEQNAAVYIIPPIFVLVGLGLALLGPWLYMRRRRMWVYALTNKRAILLLHNQTRTYDIKPYMVLSSRASEQGLGKLVFEKELQNSGKSSATVEWGFMRCRGLAEPLQLLENMLDGLALESSKSPEVRKQEHKAKLMALAQIRYLMPILLTVHVISLGILIHSGINILQCLDKLQDQHRSWSVADIFFAAGDKVLLGIFAFLGSGYMICKCLRGRKLLREQRATSSDAP